MDRARHSLELETRSTRRNTVGREISRGGNDTNNQGIQASAEKRGALAESLSGSPFLAPPAEDGGTSRGGIIIKAKECVVLSSVAAAGGGSVGGEGSAIHSSVAKIDEAGGRATLRNVPRSTLQNTDDARIPYRAEAGAAAASEGVARQPVRSSMTT